MTYTESFNEALAAALDTAKLYRHEYVTPEHILSALLRQDPFCIALEECMCNSRELQRHLNEYLKKIESVPTEIEYSQELSFQMNEMINNAYLIIQNSGAEQMTIPHIVQAMLTLRESWAAEILKSIFKENLADFLSELVTQYECYEEMNEISEASQTEAWRNFVTCLNDNIATHNPLIGREEELERTIQILCRRDKNNPLHIGEPGVGKTALAYGLAALIENGNVPERLQGYKVYELDLGTMLAGTQFRGDFEKRIKSVMEGLCEEGKAIVYIDEIHNLVGAGRSSESSMDASNMLKPYLERDDIRFMGSTTYEEYNKYLSRSKGIVRRFSQIEVPEPTIDETIKIIEGLIKRYEAHHNVKYAKGVIEYAVKASAKFINDRHLPDKAIDLIDEAGAYRELHPLTGKRGTNRVDKALIMDILSRICKVDSMAMKEEDTAALETLYPRISSQIYGQDEAIREIVSAVQMSKAGLLDENKPLASLLFVGPTGVGKTEVAKVLSAELGISLLRFDMSEYTEKHTVAKLIGSPAGYIGYEDGGLLTDAIRKTPNCVLLLDEIEKAHPDIFNILLQVMDYAMLTDNKGRKSDFRHVILIMTSNAGAQHAHKASIGFDNKVRAGEAMLKQVKKSFKPEFINRLSGTIIFNDMDRKMATLILDKKLRELQDKLTSKGVTMHLTDAAKELLLNRGFTTEYGAREIDRVISSMLKPLLTKEILFGKLKKGGEATIDTNGTTLTI